MPLLAICQYRLGELDPEDSLGILERHPLTLVGSRVYENKAYRGQFDVLLAEEETELMLMHA